jgi:hypothetical protein
MTLNPMPDGVLVLAVVAGTVLATMSVVLGDRPNPRTGRGARLLIVVV